MIATLTIPGLRPFDFPAIPIEGHIQASVEFRGAPMLPVEGAGVFPSELSRLFCTHRFDDGDIVRVGVDTAKDLETSRRNWRRGGGDMSSSAPSERPARLRATGQIWSHFQIRFKSLGASWRKARWSSSCPSHSARSNLKGRGQTGRTAESVPRRRIIAISSTKVPSSSLSARGWNAHWLKPRRV